jgi:hypothetical protein
MLQRTQRPQHCMPLYMTINLMTHQQTFKLLFHRDFIMPFASLALFFMTFISIKDYGLKLTDLDKYVGLFSSCDSVVIKVKDKPLFKQVTQRLDIRLDNSPYNFTITTTDNFGYIISEISKGDTLSIWTKSDKEKVIQTKDVSINHLVHKDKILVDFDKTFAITPSLIIFSLFGAFGFLIWYYFRIRKRLQIIRTV